MFGRILCLVLGCTISGAAVGAPLDVCPTLATGNWVIVSVQADEGPVALSTEEARAYIGKRISVSAQQISFAGTKCRAFEQSVVYSVGDDFDIPGFPYLVSYDCADKAVFVPSFNVGRGCNHIITGLDGWTFKLRRAK